MAWLRKMPMYAVLLLISGVLIGVAALGYYAYATFSTTVLKGSLNTGGHAHVYEWRGERLLLQEVTGRTDSGCVINGPGSAKRSVFVPRNISKGMFNAADFTEVAPQPGIRATITCSNTVRLTAGDSAVARARTVNSYLFKVGAPALTAIPVLAALGIPMLRRSPGGKGVS